MWLRRLLFVAQFPFAVALSAWVFVTRGILADGIGAQLLAYAFVCPIITLALMAVSGVIVARKGVRLDRAVSWYDAEWLGVIWLLLFAFGLFAQPLLAVLIALVIIAAFWFEVFELFNETRARVKTALDLGPTGAPRGQGRYRGDVIVVAPPDELKR